MGATSKDAEGVCACASRWGQARTGQGGTVARCLQVRDEGIIHVLRFKVAAPTQRLRVQIVRVPLAHRRSTRRTALGRDHRTLSEMQALPDQLLLQGGHHRRRVQQQILIIRNEPDDVRPLCSESCGGYCAQRERARCHPTSGKSPASIVRREKSMLQGFRCYT